MRIEACGGIASGKTTLAKCLQMAGVKAIFEDFHSNPFWKLFYAFPQRYAFETEVTFLLQHYSQHRDATESSRLPFICDSSILQDMAYAEVNLQKTQLATFQNIYEEVSKLMSAPTLRVVLRCSEQEELRRIRARARLEETKIELSYLRKLNKSINRLIEHEEDIPHIEIDSEALDFATNRKHQVEVIDLLMSAID